MKTRILLCLLALSLWASAQTRIMVFSDPHVMHTSLFTNDSLFADYTRSEPKLVEHSQQLFDSAVQVVLQEHPHLLLIPGDLTKDGELINHQYVHERLQEIQQAGTQVLVIPGNHDLTCPAAYSYIGNQKMRVATVSEQQFDSIYHDCGYADAVLRQEGSLSYMAYPTTQLAIICMNSCQANTTSRQSAGGLDEKALTFVDSAAAMAIRDGRTPILMMHHPVVEHFSHHAQEAATYLANTLESYPSPDTLRTRLIRAGIQLTLTGHYHIHSAQQVSQQDTLVLTDVSTGSLCSYPSPIRRMMFYEDGVLDISSSVFPTFHQLERQRNANTAKGAIRSIATRLYPKMDEIRNDLPTLAGRFNLPNDQAELIEMCNQFLLPPYTELINTLSQGDEEQNGPEDKYNACMDSLDSFFMYVCKGNIGYTALLKGLTFISGYYTEYMQMCHSVFYNYAYTQQNVVPDAELSLALRIYSHPAPSLDDDSEGKTANEDNGLTDTPDEDDQSDALDGTHAGKKVAGKVLRDGRIVIITPTGLTYSPSGQAY